MTLYTTDYLEYYLTLVGWIINNGVWNVLVASGVSALPFLAIILQEWLKARTEGADEGNKGVLSSMRIENRVWVAIAVILFAGIPFVPVDMSIIQFDQTRSTQCQVDVPAPAKTGWARSFTTLNNQTAKVPLWWFFMHSLSKGVTGAAVAAIPCGTDLRQLRIEVYSLRISDPLLAQEVADFAGECYGPARAKLFMNRPELSDEQTNDVSWIGSHYFQRTAGYYDTYHAKTPQSRWPYNAVRDAGLAQVANGGGYPTCRQWWADGSSSLRQRLLAIVDPSLISKLARWAGFLTQAKLDDALLQAVASPRQQTISHGQTYSDYGGQIDPTSANQINRAASDFGVGIGSIGLLPTFDVVRQALPMVLSFLKMALAICIPLVLIVGTYDLKAVVTISCVEFALFFVEFWFQLARWIDSTILDALYGWTSPHSNFNPLMGLNNAFGDVLLNIIMGSMFLVLPAFWVSALTWVGIRAGGLAQTFTTGAGDAKTTGGKGTAVAIAAAKTR
jgi:hypothetical protein